MHAVSRGTIIAEVRGQFLETLGKPQGGKVRESFQVATEGARWEPHPLRGYCSTPSPEGLAQAITIFLGMSWHLLFFFFIGGFIGSETALRHTVDHPFILGSPLLTMSVDVAWFELLTYGVSCNQDTSFVLSTLAFTWFSIKFVFYPQTIFTEKKKKERERERERKDANICITEEDQIEEPSYSWLGHLHRTWSYFQIRSLPAIARSPPTVL